MKPLRVIYLLVLVISLSLILGFYLLYRQKDKGLAHYQKLSWFSGKAFTEVKAKLTQSNKELEGTLKEVDRLNRVIADLESNNLDFKGELQALKREREDLQAKIAKLVEEKTVLEMRFFVLEKRFHSLEELKKAIRIVKKERRQQWIQRRLRRIAMLKKLDEFALQQGNRGFTIRNGRSTFKPPSIKVELEPLGKFSYRE